MPSSVASPPAIDLSLRQSSAVFRRNAIVDNQMHHHLAVMTSSASRRRSGDRQWFVVIVLPTSITGLPVPRCGRERSRPPASAPQEAGFSLTSTAAAARARSVSRGERLAQLRRRRRRPPGRQHRIVAVTAVPPHRRSIVREKCAGHGCVTRRETGCAATVVRCCARR